MLDNYATNMTAILTPTDVYGVYDTRVKDIQNETCGCG